MLLAFLVFAVYWIVIMRQARQPWPDVTTSVLMMLGIFGVIAWLLPPWAWQVAMLGYVGMPWWRVPFHLWRTGRFPMRSAVAEFDPDQHAVPPDLHEAVEREADALAAAGMVRIGTFWSQGPGNTTALQAVMETPDGLEAVMVTGQASVMLPGTPQEERSQAVYAVYGVRFADGRGLSVANTEVMERVPGKRVECLPGVRESAQLLAVGRAYRERFLPDARLVPGREGQPPLQAMEARELRHWQALVRTGRYRLLDDDHAGFTLRGAFMATLSLQFPFRQIGGMRMRMRERRLLRALGFAPPKPATGRWWMRPGDLTGAALAAMALALLIPMPRLSSFAYPLPEGVEMSTFAAVQPKPYALPEGFAVPPDFPGAVRALEQLAGMRAVPLEVEDGATGDVRRSDGVEVRFAADRTDSLIARAGPLFRARGFLLFRDEYTFGIGGEPEYVALYPRDDPAEVMRLIGANGTNFGIDTDSVVAWFGRLNARHPFVLTGVGHDYVEGRFVRRPTAQEAQALAREFYAFCPDVVDQGTGTVRKLAAEIRREAVIYCWWD